MSKESMINRISVRIASSFCANADCFVDSNRNKKTARISKKESIRIAKECIDLANEIIASEREAAGFWDKLKGYGKKVYDNLGRLVDRFRGKKPQNNTQNNTQNTQQNNIHNPQNNIHNPQNNIHNPQNNIHNPQNNIHNPQNNQQNNLQNIQQDNTEIQDDSLVHNINQEKEENKNESKYFKIKATSDIEKKEALNDAQKLEIFAEIEYTHTAKPKKGKRSFIKIYPTRLVNVTGKSTGTVLTLYAIKANENGHDFVKNPLVREFHFDTIHSVILTNLKIPGKSGVELYDIN